MSSQVTLPVPAHVDMTIAPTEVLALEEPWRTTHCALGPAGQNQSTPGGSRRTTHCMLGPAGQSQLTSGRFRAGTASGGRSLPGRSFAYHPPGTLSRACLREAAHGGWLFVGAVDPLFLRFSSWV